MVEKESGISRWSDIHDEILQLIMEPLGMRDRVRFRAVCKNWRLQPSAKDEKRPWILSKYPHSKGEIKWKLCEPCYRHSEIKRLEPYISKIKDPDGIFLNARACATKCGWVLFAQKIELETASFMTYDEEEEDGEADPDPDRFAFFLYNPFKKELITLPDFAFNFAAKNDEGRESGTILFAKFSSTPTRSDCVFFLLVEASLSDDDLIAITTYQRGEESWNTVIPSFDKSYLPIQSVAFMGGCFYCFFRDGELGSFNIKTREWTMICTRKNFPDQNFHDRRRCGYLVESTEFDGELLLLLFGSGPFTNKLYSFDWTGKGWIEKKSLNQQAIFFDGRTSISISTKEIGSRIYFNTGKGPLYLTCDGENISGPSFQACTRSRMWIEPPSLEG